MSDPSQLIFGINPILEKLKAAPHDVLEIIVAARPERPALRLIGVEAKRRGVRLSYADPKVLHRLAQGQKHQGAVARVAIYSYAAFPELLQALTASSQADWIWVLILDGLTDPHNLGALLRTAEAVGIRSVIIPKDRSVGVTPTVVKASAGAVHHLNVYRVTNLRRAIQELKKLAFWIVGLDVRGGENIYDRVHPRKLGIVLGSEGAGIRPLIRRECDCLVSIPMLGKMASLNVSVAGAVFVYELLRQKQSVDKDKAKG